ncbi:DNA-directed RNA polymerase subunit E'' [archaeon]|nr:DNA-directed RNA polymerase subunit E'' [archaeon]
MTKKKCCKKCKIFFEGTECPICKENKISTNWQGRVYIVDAEKSEIAKKIGVGIKGEYALKCR